MRTVTMKELDAFVMAVDALQVENARLAQLTNAAQAVTLGLAADNRPLEGAAVGAKAIGILTADKELMYERFYQPAFDFTGERRFPGESYEEYFYRITSMTASQLLMSAGRNGLRLDLRPLP